MTLQELKQQVLDLPTADRWMLLKLLIEKNDQAIAAKGDNCMSDLPMGWEPNRDRPMIAKHLRADLAKMETFTQEMSHENPI
ncbi:MAG: hypothetical protein ACRC8A_01275 [Microcoleaceae cyanobacterium]